MSGFLLLTVGCLLIAFGLIGLVYKLYNINASQGAMMEVEPLIMGAFFGLLNWKHTKVPLLMMLCGIFMIGTVFVL